ncbi:unnamed protein product [Urochloa decumbens]|uniref:F-box domain-containing protein n=1 Tax=Urochloa decumbens TaxID=240449 RepID=A0ABC8WHZ3_9POAL
MTAPAIQSSTAPSPLGLISDDVVAEILLRLPPAYVLRCGAVCRAWRAISTSPGFAAAYARRRPLELIVQRHGFNGVLDTIPLATLDEGSRRCIDLAYPERGKCKTTGRPLEGPFRLMGSCDGLLLFEEDSYYGTDHWVCNPVTQQWTASVPPRSARLTRICGLYLHGPSGEHRLLFLTNDDDCGGMGTSASHYVRSLEAGETRRLGPAAATVHMFSQIITEHLEYHGKLHWLDHPEAMETGKILAFDTVSETFRRMSRPPSMNRHGKPSLLEMDGKVSMAAVLKGLHMDLWVLEDYGDDESWARRHRIDLPPAFSRTRWAMNASVLGRSSNVILLGDNASGSLGLYDLVENRVVKQVQLVTNATREKPFWPCTQLNAHVFNDSLERHAFFDIIQNTPPDEECPWCSSSCNM